MGIIKENKMIRGIPVLLCRRDDAVKKPLIILSHGFTGSKEDFNRKGYLEELAELGYYAVALDNRFHGDRPGPDFRSAVLHSNGEADLYLLRKVMKDTADDVKLLIDELSDLEEVEEDRIAMLGVSMGGFITYRSIVIDDRIKVGLPVISSPYWDDIPGDVAINKDRKIDLEEFSGIYQPSKHMDKFYPSALLIQAGAMDQHYDIQKIQSFCSELRQLYVDSPDKIQLIIYPDTKHEFKQEMWEQALTWLKEYL